MRVHCARACFPVVYARSTEVLSHIRQCLVTPPENSLYQTSIIINFRLHQDNKVSHKTKLNPFSVFELSNQHKRVSLSAAPLLCAACFIMVE